RRPRQGAGGNADGQRDADADAHDRVDRGRTGRRFDRHLLAGSVAMANHRSLVVCAIALLFGASGIARVADSRVADAAMNGDAAPVRTLVQQGADVNVTQGDGMTALHWAAERGDLDLATSLLASGARAGAATRIGRHTP